MSKTELLKLESSEIILDKNKFQSEIELNNQEEALSLMEKNSMEDFLVEKIINKWLNLQKIIKEEITLEDVIIKQQQEDTKNLKSYFVEYFNIKLNSRKIWNEIKELKLEEKQQNLPQVSSFEINQDLNNFHDASEPIKNLFFILRNNYDYLTRLTSLINPEDFSKNFDNINSLVELLNNNFYENILLPNPEQQELLILIYKLLENEIVPMGGVCPQNFLKDDTLSGIFLSAFTKKQEIIGYFSMILNYLILSIDDNDSKENFDLNISNIIKSIDNEPNELKKSTTKSDIIYKKYGYEKSLKNIIFKDIPKTNIKFKNSFELEAEKEKEDERKFTLDEKGFEEYGTVYINKTRKTIAQKNLIKFGNKENNIEYNTDYKKDLTQNKLIDKILKEKNHELKHIYKKLLDQTNNYPNKFTNEGLLKLLRTEVEKKLEKDKNSENIKKQDIEKKLLELAENFRYNFLYIKDIIEDLLQIIIDKIIILPYPLRCICKIIKILISKKFPELKNYEVNSFIGKFILDKCIFPLLRLENKIFLDPRVYSKRTKNCLDVIISVLSKANSASLFDTYLDPEKTIFNQFILEIIPILNEFYDKIIDIKLPKVIDELITKTVINLEDPPNKKIFNFRNKPKNINSNNGNLSNDKNHDIKKSESSNAQEQKPLFEYFGENPDEILHLQSICFSVSDIKFIIELIGRNIDIFKGLPRFNFFSKTYTKIKNQDEIINSLCKEDSSKQKKIYYVIFKDEKNSILEQLAKKEKKSRSSFLSSEQDSELICKRIKFCVKTILKGLNLLNNKDFAYLNFAQSSDKFFSALKYTLEELGEYNELSNDIPLKWYSQYIYNYKKELNIEYQKEDFSKLYSEISTEETNILNELKQMSNIVITRDGMNLRCAEKILSRSRYELKRIEEAKKLNQLEKFINTKKIELCVKKQDDILKNKLTDKPLINIIESKSCQNYNNNSNNEGHSHINNINDFIQLFDRSSTMHIREKVKEDISKGERKNKIFEIIGKYMEFVVKKIKEEKNIFGDIQDIEIRSFYRKIENYIMRKIYKYTFPKKHSHEDNKIFEKTRKLEWIQPENLDIKKLYVNQLKFAEKYINRINERKSVYDKLDCIQNAYVIMNNTVKFISGKNENAGQDDFTPLFQYILIKSQPERLVSNINYIKCFISDTDLIGENGFYFSQMVSGKTFIENIKASDLKMDEKEYNAKIDKYNNKYDNKHNNIKDKDKNNDNKNINNKSNKLS